MPRRVITNRAVAPYYDDYDPTKQYTQLLAIPGRVAQAREITQLQSTMKDIIKSVGDSLLKDGNIIEGCQIIVDSTKTHVTVTSGKIYMNGMVLPVEETTVNITGIGIETIGAKLVEYLITEQEDTTLRDPALGYDNYNQAGCHRIQSEIMIVRNDAQSAVISTLLEGSVYIENYAPEYDTLSQTLARRTYDESGSYLVEGLKVRTESSSTAGKYNVVIEAGKAYVLGYELRIPSARRLIANRSITYSSDIARRTYQTGQDTYILYNDHPFIKEITEVIGAKEKEDNISVGTDILSQTDIILDSNYFTISSTQGGTAEYAYGTDYTVIQQGDVYSVSWINPPTLGTSYWITYRYNKVFDASDYSIEYATVSGEEGHAIKWAVGGDTPINNTSFSVRYTQYLARKDVVYMDRYGTISIVEGVPATYNRDTIPETPVNTLSLAIIHNPPNGGVVAVENSIESIMVDNIGLTRFTMKDIQSIVNRVKTIEYDQAILSLNDEAKNDDTTDKKGIFTDPLIDLSRIDFYFNKNSIIYDMALDLYNNIAYLPVDSSTDGVTVNNANSTTKKYDRLVTISTTGENVVLAQPNATKLFPINPYSVFPQLPAVTITPAVDSWIEDTIIQIPISIREATVVALSTRTIDNVSSREASNPNYEIRSSVSVSDTAIGTKTTSYSKEDIVSERAITYIRQRTLTIEGFNFYDTLDNIRATFDGVSVSLTPIEGTLAGTAGAGTVKATNGHIKATFTIPANILTGTREIRLYSEEPEIEGYHNEGFTFYVAQGLARTIHNTVTTVTTVLLERVTTTTLSAVYIDPIGQTFVLPRMTMLKGIDLYFGNKPAAGINIPVSCELREVNNGAITSKVYASKSLLPSEVSVSNDTKDKRATVNITSSGSNITIPSSISDYTNLRVYKNEVLIASSGYTIANTTLSLVGSTITAGDIITFVQPAATRFNFDDPVLIEENKEYAFVIKSMSDAYTAWVAELGGTDVATDYLVLKNAYMTGVMLSSSNNSTWTAHQTTDVKFQLIEDVYSATSTIRFDELTADEFSRIYLSADAVIPIGTDITWSYKLNGEANYRPITPYNIVTMNQLKTSISLMAILTKDSSVNLSPMLALDTIAVTTSCYDTSNTNGYYITKNITNLAQYTDVKVIIDVYEPSASTVIDVKISNDDGNTLSNSLSRSLTSTTLNYKWKEYSYSATVSASTSCRIFIKATSSNKYETPAFRRLRVIFS